jgi:hypothetical protein
MIRYAMTGAAAAAMLTFFVSIPVNSSAVSVIRSLAGAACGGLSGIVLFYIMNAVKMPLKRQPDEEAEADNVDQAAEDESFQEEDAE